MFSIHQNVLFNDMSTIDRSPRHSFIKPTNTVDQNDVIANTDVLVTTEMTSAEDVSLLPCEDRDDYVNMLPSIVDNQHTDIHKEQPSNGDVGSHDDVDGLVAMTTTSFQRYPSKDDETCLISDAMNAPTEENCIDPFPDIVHPSENSIDPVEEMIHLATTVPLETRRASTTPEQTSKKPPSVSMSIDLSTDLAAVQDVGLDNGNDDVDGEDIINVSRNDDDEDTLLGR